MLKKIIIIAFLFIIILMAVGYSTFATELSINGTAEITGTWDVRITDIKALAVSENCSAGAPTFTDTSVNFFAKLNKPGDEITYQVTIKNLGTIDAELQSVVFLEEKDGIEAINYTTTSLDHDLNAGGRNYF